MEKLYFKDKIAIICGGSKGIGKETSKLIVKMGGNVLIIARNAEVLKTAAEEMNQLKILDSQFVEFISCDTTDMEKLKPLIEDFIGKHRVPDYLINMVGYAYPSYIEKLTLDDFKKNMNVNYYGQLVPILILLPYFMKEKRGYIANTSSVLGYLGMMSYATYCPSKYAIVGLTESLRHELKPYHIKCSIFFPSDTDTPGLAKENEISPEECKILSNNVKLLSAEESAKVFIKGIRKRKFNILSGGAKMFWILHRYVPRLVRFYGDIDYKKARKSLGKI
ncbi:MAG: SDR family NAD(P)-dependent oxidoreductase [Promethearchaeota archaeon]